MNIRNSQRGRVTPALRMTRLLALLVTVLMILPCAIACNQNKQDNEPKHVHVDYVADTKLDMSSESLKIEATVKTYIDGDTTHFFVDDTASFPEGYVKARYLAIDTPESTGKIEAWGKTAANFTKEKLKNAYAIMLESDTSVWNTDSNGRSLLWVWYKPDENSDWRNLNIEILQNGYAYASNSGQNRYGATCMSALNQADAENLYVHSSEKDPSYPYAAATLVSIKELRANPAAYDGCKVAVTGVIAQKTASGLYLEEFDAEDNQYYGMYVYYGYNLPFGTEGFIKTGNSVYYVGIFQYATAVDAYQIGGIVYDMMKPGDPAYTHLVEKDQQIAFTPADIATLTTGETEVSSPDGDVVTTYLGDFSALHTSVSLEGLKVIKTYTTEDPESNSKGAISLTCEKDGKQITVRTIVLYEDGQLVTADRFEGKTIDVKGIVDAFAPEGSTTATIQVKVFSLDNIIIH